MKLKTFSSYIGLAGMILTLTFTLFFLSLSRAKASPPAGFQNQLWIVNLDQPTSVAFLPDGRMLIAERLGKVWVVQPRATSVDPTPFLQITNINTDQGERGLVGLALDPDFATNKGSMFPIEAFG